MRLDGVRRSSSSLRLRCVCVCVVCCVLWVCTWAAGRAKVRASSWMNESVSEFELLFIANHTTAPHNTRLCLSHQLNRTIRLCLPSRAQQQGSLVEDSQSDSAGVCSSMGRSPESGSMPDHPSVQLLAQAEPQPEHTSSLVLLSQTTGHCVLGRVRYRAIMHASWIYPCPCMAWQGGSAPGGVPCSYNKSEVSSLNDRGSPGTGREYRHKSRVVRRQSSNPEWPKSTGRRVHPPLLAGLCH